MAGKGYDPEDPFGFGNTFDLDGDGKSSDWEVLTMFDEFERWSEEDRKKKEAEQKRWNNG